MGEIDENFLDKKELIMTLVTVYRKNPITEADAEGIICLSDSLITESTDPTKSYTENSIKILSLSFGYYFDDGSYPKLIQNEIGLAYAGNTAIALQVYNTLRIFCNNLVPRKQTKYFTPSLASIANMLKMILNKYYLSYGEQLYQSYSSPLNQIISNVDFLIFGFCFHEKKFKLFHISTGIIDDRADTRVNDVDLEQIKQYSIGTGKEAFNKFCEQYPQKNILHCFKEFVKTDLAKEKATGGFLIKTFAGIGYFKYYAEVSDNNYDLSQINYAQIGGFSITPYITDDYMISFIMNPFLG